MDDANTGKLCFLLSCIQLIHSFIIKDLLGVYEFSLFFQVCVLYSVGTTSLYYRGFRDHFPDSSITFEKSSEVRYIFSVFRSK